MMDVLFLFAVAAGDLSLMIAMERHHRALLGRAPRPSRQRLLRNAGSAALLLALTLAVGDKGLAIGLTQWIIAIGLVGSAISYLSPLVRFES